MPDKRGRPIGIIASEDMLAVVCLLKRLGWSNSQIGKIFRRHHETIRDWYNIGYHTIGNNLSAIIVKNKRWVKMIKPIGKSDDVAYLYGKIHQSPCGGGHRIMPHHYNKGLEDNRSWEDEQEVRGDD